jgi:hypothetical protein
VFTEIYGVLCQEVCNPPAARYPQAWSSVGEAGLVGPVELVELLEGLGETSQAGVNFATILVPQRE